MKTDTIEKEAKRLRTHSVVFSDVEDVRCAIRAMQGITTKAIAAELGITPSRAQYRILKAQNSLGQKFRGDYRSGQSPMAQYIMAVSYQEAERIVKKDIAPKFKPFAAIRPKT